MYAAMTPRLPQLGEFAHPVYSKRFTELIRLAPFVVSSRVPDSGSRT